MTDNRLLDLVDARDFRTLFIDELGWENPNQPDTSFDIDGQTFTFSQVAGYKGMRIWHCPQLPPRKVQRALDVLVGQSNQERLLIFSSTTRQDWRWPRRAQLGGTNAKLLAHEHVVGDRNTHLTQRLHAIELDFDEDLSLVALLEKMRDAFDHEAETASVAAARMMGTLYTELENAGVAEHEATLLLARLLFLMFGDDTDMWQPANLFHRWIEDHTTPDSLHAKLAELFDVLNTDTEKRKRPGGSEYEQFRYVNGGLFADPLRLPMLTEAFSGALIEACKFDWSVISPAVFGSMFQTVKSREARRHGGEHYTSEENILKTIRPLFLDEYTDRLDRAWDDKAQLTRLHNDLGKLRFLDPACGCGNFLIVAYRELRALELELLKRRRDLDLLDGKSTGSDRWQMSLDVTGDIKVRLDHFYGIEIEEWPARIAETAMLLVDHLANQRMTEEFGIAPDRLPIRIAPTIKHANALHTDWHTLIRPSDDVVILGNPPFKGQHTKTAQQVLDTKAIWGPLYNGYLDYVTCWYAKAIKYYENLSGRWAFVSTNSICQGEPVEFLWRPILAAGWRCRFAHRSFQWITEAPGGAGVHVSIVGFDKATLPKPVLWTYPEGGKGEGTPHAVRNINPYLVGADNVMVGNRSLPLVSAMPKVGYGTKPADGGHLIVTSAQYEEVVADPIAAKYVRRLIGARELIHDLPRWCLWLEGTPPSDMNDSPVLQERIANCGAWRSEQATGGDAYKLRDTPHLFRPNRSRPTTSYLAIPEVSGETRRFLPVRRLSNEYIATNKVYCVPDKDGFVLGILSSTMFITWMRTVGGRLESRLSFSSTFTYNNFPLPKLTARQRQEVVETAANLSRVRSGHEGKSLATLYDPTSMPDDLVAAHDSIDRVVDRIFGCPSGGISELDRQRLLFRTYAQLTGQETSAV